MSLNAGTVLARLTELGHDTSITKQVYRSEINGQTCVVYDPNSLAEVSVRASQVDHYVGKGFLVELPAAEVEAPAKKGAK